MRYGLVFGNVSLQVLDTPGHTPRAGELAVCKNLSEDTVSTFRCAAALKITLCSLWRERPLSTL